MTESTNNSKSTNTSHHLFLCALREKHPTASICRLATRTLNVKSECQKSVKYLHRKVPGRIAVKKHQLLPLSVWFADCQKLRTSHDKIDIEYGNPLNTLRKSVKAFPVRYFQDSVTASQRARFPDQTHKLYALLSKKRKESLRKYRVVVQSTDSLLSIHL